MCLPITDHSSLQMNSIVNIAESAYSQLKKLKNEDNDLDNNVNKNKTQVVRYFFED